MSSRRLPKTSWRYLQDILKTSSKDVFETSLTRFQVSSRIFQDFLKMYHQVRLFFFNVSSRRVQGIFKAYCKNHYLQKDLPRLYVLEFYVQGTNFPRVNSLNVSKVLVKCFQNASWSSIADVRLGWIYLSSLQKYLRWSFLRKTGTNSFILHFDQNFKHNF